MRAINHRLADFLRLFDLTTYEAKTYLALVINGPSTVKGIRELAEIPYSREYDILAGVQKQGFVEFRPGRPRVYRAVDPREIIAKKLEERKVAARELLLNLEALFKKPKYEMGGEVIWAIRNTEHIRKKLKDVIRNANRKILILGIHPVCNSNIGKALIEAARKGVKIRGLGTFDADCLKVLKRIKAEIMHYPPRPLTILLGRQ